MNSKGQTHEELCFLRSRFLLASPASREGENATLFALAFVSPTLLTCLSVSDEVLPLSLALPVLKLARFFEGDLTTVAFVPENKAVNTHQHWKILSVFKTAGYISLRRYSTRVNFHATRLAIHI